MLCVLLRFVLNRTGILTLDRGGGQALLMIVLSATVASALAGLCRWAQTVAATHASGEPRTGLRRVI